MTTREGILYSGRLLSIYLRRKSSNVMSKRVLHALGAVIAKNTMVPVPQRSLRDRGQYNSNESKLSGLVLPLAACVRRVIVFS